MSPRQDQNKYVPSCMCLQAWSAGKYSLHNRPRGLFALILQINVTTEMWVKTSTLLWHGGLCVVLSKYYRKHGKVVLSPDACVEQVQRVLKF